jgi:hypothetical protein
MPESKEISGLSEQERLETFRELVGSVKYFRSADTDFKDMEPSKLSLELADYFKELQEVFTDLGAPSVADWFLHGEKAVMQTIRNMPEEEAEKFLARVQSIVDKRTAKRSYLNKDDEHLFLALTTSLTWLNGMLMNNTMGIYKKTNNE